jgi:hypothetical protein
MPHSGSAPSIVDIVGRIAAKISKSGFRALVAAPEREFAEPSADNRVLQSPSRLAAPKLFQGQISALIKPRIVLPDISQAPVIATNGISRGA